MDKKLLAQENWDCEKAREILNSDGINASHRYMGANTLLIHVKDFETMRALFRGSGWAIGREKAWWDAYLKGNKKQFVLVNYLTAKTLKDVVTNPLSLIAFTFDADSEQYTEASDGKNNNVAQYIGNNHDSAIDEVLTKLGVTKKYVKRLLRNA